jgi:hypothetical protein
MIRLLVKLGQWLEKRFPEKLEVSKVDYDTLIQRISNLESTAVHKNAVQDVIKVVAQVKNDVASLKTSLGFAGQAESSKIEAFLSGEPVSTQENG